MVARARRGAARRPHAHRVAPRRGGDARVPARRRRGAPNASARRRSAAPLAAALVRVVPDREADEGPGPDVAEEVDAFATEYAELILIGLSKVPRLADGRTPVEVVPDAVLEDKADREWLGFTHKASYVRRTRHVLVKRERDRRRAARELAVASCRSTASRVGGS